MTESVGNETDTACENRVESGQRLLKPGQTSSLVWKNATIPRISTFPRRAASSTMISDLQIAPDRWR